MLTSNEEISKIEKTYFKKHRQVFLVPEDRFILIRKTVSIFNSTFMNLKIVGLVLNAK